MALQPQDARLVQELRHQSETTLMRLLPEPQPVALIDLPSHQNVGDTMIWAGETEYLKRLGFRVGYASDLIRFDKAALERAVPDGPILLHGGGNFGDIWPVFQEFREMIVRLFPRRRIIQMPQTVFFQSRDAARRANLRLSEHPEFTLLVREYSSLERAKIDLPGVSTEFCPDMAIGWTPDVTQARISPHRILVLGRRDLEASSRVAEAVAPLLGPSDYTMDWGLAGLDSAKWALARAPLKAAKISRRLRRSKHYYASMAFAYRFNAAQNLKDGMRHFAGSELVITDRLHAHILAGLLGVPHLILDNNYGKIRSVFDAYSGAFSSAQMFDHNNEVISAVQHFQLDRNTSGT